MLDFSKRGCLETAAAAVCLERDLLYVIIWVRPHVSSKDYG